MPQAHYTLEMPEVFDCPAEAEDFRGTSWSTLSAVGYVGSSGKGARWAVLCACGAVSVRRASTWRKALSGKAAPRCDRCMGTGRAPQPAQAVTVSDHALVRYIERVLGVDVEQIRAEMLPPDAAAGLRRLGSGRYPMRGPDGPYHVVVKDGTVVTVLDD